MANCVYILAMAVISVFLLPVALYAEQYYSVQVGSVGEKEKANKLVSRLQASGMDCTQILQGSGYKVLCGRFDTPEQVDTLKKKLISKGYADAFGVKVSGTDGVSGDDSNVLMKNGGGAPISNLEDQANGDRTSSDEEPSAGGPTAGQYFAVQVGSLGTKAKAQKLLSRLLGDISDCEAIPQGSMYKIVCGRFPDTEGAIALKQKLIAKGYTDAFTVSVGIVGRTDTDTGKDVPLAEDRQKAPPADTAASVEYYAVQVNGLSDKALAQKIQSKLYGAGIECRTLGQDFRYKVVCGRFQDKNSALSLKLKLLSLGYANAMTVQVIDDFRTEIMEDDKALDEELARILEGAAAVTPGKDEFYSIQAGSSSERDRAQKLQSRLLGSGLDCDIVSQRLAYKVLCGRFDNISDAIASRQKLISLGYADAFTVRRKIVKEEPYFPDAFGLEEGEPLEQTSADVFGRSGGYAHPFAVLTGVYTDNLYSSRRNPQEDFVTVISAGIWVAASSIKQPLRDISTTGMMPGGIRTTVIIPPQQRRNLGYFMYRADSKNYSDHDWENNTSQTLKVYYGYKSPKGNRLVVDDIYLSSSEFIGNSIAAVAGIANSSDSFSTNRMHVMSLLRFTPKISAGFDYAVYEVDYSGFLGPYRDRRDGVGKAGLNLHLSPKTEISVEYSFASIDYDENIRRDRKETAYSMAVGWNVTGKTYGRLYAGISKNSYEASASDDDDDSTVYGLSVNHKVSPKTFVRISASSSRVEPDDAISDYVLSDTWMISTIWDATPKVRGILSIRETDNSYYWALPGGVDRSNREDKRTVWDMSFNYALNRHVTFEAGLSDTRRKSTSDIYNFKAAKWFFGMTASF